MNAIIFTRGNSKAQQREICEKYAKENGHYIICTTDDEKTLTVEILGGGIECVIVSDASRITRRRSEYIEAEKMLNNFGVKLIAVNGKSL